MSALVLAARDLAGCSHASLLHEPLYLCEVCGGHRRELAQPWTLPSAVQRIVGSLPPALPAPRTARARRRARTRQPGGAVPSVLAFLPSFEGPDPVLLLDLAIGILDDTQTILDALAPENVSGAVVDAVSSSAHLRACWHEYRQRHAIFADLQAIQHANFTALARGCLRELRNTGS
jgi:hypothetical protein